jgi:hypothetical protein
MTATTVMAGQHGREERGQRDNINKGNDNNDNDNREMVDSKGEE